MSSQRITFVLKGHDDAIKRLVRRMLDNHGLTGVAFEMEPLDPHQYFCDKQTDPAFPCNCQRGEGQRG